MALMPAAAAWEVNDELLRLSVALHGAAELLGVILEEGVPRQDIGAALGRSIGRHVGDQGAAPRSRRRRQASWIASVAWMCRSHGCACQ